MMNELLRDLINTGKVAVFIDDVIIGMETEEGHDKIVAECHMQVHLSRKLHPRSDATSEPYKPAFHGGHLSRNTSYGGAATFRIFRLPRRRYSYSTQSSMTELLLSVSQH